MGSITFGRFHHACSLFIFILLITGCGGGGGGVDEDTTPDEWGSPGTGKDGIPIFWTRLGGNALSGSASILETADHGFVAVGFRQADGGVPATGTVVKTGSTGAILWEKEFSDTGYVVILNCIRKTADGGYVAAGVHRSATDNTDPGTFLVLRMDADGNALPGWPKWDYEVSYSGGATSLCESRNASGDPDGFVFTGNVNIPLANNMNDQYCFAEKIDLNGNVVWKKSYTGKKFGTDVAASIVQDENQGFLIAGTEGNPDDEVWVNRIDANGASLAGWPRYYGSGNAMSVKKTPDGGFILVGDTFSDWSNEAQYNDVLAIKVDSQGEVVWRRAFGGYNTSDSGSDVDLCSDGGYIVAGTTSSYDPENSTPKGEVFLIRLDSSGNPLWQRVKGRTSSGEGASAVVAASDGGFAIAGSAGGSFLVAKFDSIGNTINLGENDYTLTVTATTGTINSGNALSLMGKGVSAVNQSVLVGGFGLDILIKVRDHPALNGTGGLAITPAPTSIPAGGPYVVSMNNYTTTYGGTTLTMNGSMTVLITSLSGTLANGSTYTANVTESAIDVTITDSEDELTSFAGRLEFHREATATSFADRVTNSSVPGASLSITGDGSTLTMSTFSNEVSTNLNTGAYTIYTNDPMVCQVTGVSSSLSLVVDPAIAGTDPMTPDSGGAELLAQDGSNVAMTISTGGNVSLEVDTDADGTVDSTILTTFDDLY